jgi:hypothetical protein
MPEPTSEQETGARLALEQQAGARLAPEQEAAVGPAPEQEAGARTAVEQQAANRPASEHEAGDTTAAQVRELDTLHAKLKRTRRQAGDPSFRVLARLSPVQQSATTVSRTFNAPCPPSWPKLKGLLLALGVPAEQIGTEWHAQWTRAANEAHPIGKPQGEPDDELLTPVSYEDLACRKCGARIDDAALHGRFHLSLDRVADMVRLLERSAKRVAVPQRSA